MEPAVVGLIAVFYIIQGAVDSFTASGFEKALIYYKDINKEYINTAFITNIIRGLALSIIVYCFAPWMVHQLSIPEAGVIVQVLALTFLIKGFFLIIMMKLPLLQLFHTVMLFSTDMKLEIEILG